MEGQYKVNTRSIQGQYNDKHLQRGREAVNGRSIQGQYNDKHLQRG